MTANYTPVWPRPYILSIHAKAVEEGCCKVPVGSAAEAKSLLASFYRVRRRGDSTHKLLFIPPEYHLVVGQYIPKEGVIIFTFDKLPEDMVLPPILSVDSTERFAPAPAQSDPAPEMEADLDIDQIVEQMAAEAKGKPPSSLD